MAVSITEVYTKCLKLKQDGNIHFKNARYTQSIQQYQKVIGAISNLSIASADKNELESKLKELKEQSLNNVAMAYINLQKWTEAKIKCSEVLKNDSFNIKALYRRGVANNRLHQHNEAVEDLQMVRRTYTDDKIEFEIQFA
eukprot:310045_1